jgi:hypothetical protein
MSTARELTNHLVRLLREEQGAMADFLLALADFDRKKLWRELGHASLFYYLHRELRLSKGAAQNRKTAAELIQAFPEVEAALRAGALCLSTVNELARVLTPENRAEVLPRFFGLSRREAEAVAMSLRPAEVVPTRDVITAFRPASEALRAATAQTALPAAAPESPTLRVHPDEPVAVHLDDPTPPVVVAAPRPLPPPPPPRESVEPLDAELARVHVTVSRRFLEKLDAAKDALAHACPGGRRRSSSAASTSSSPSTRSAAVSSRSLERAAEGPAATRSLPR